MVENFTSKTWLVLTVIIALIISLLVFIYLNSLNQDDGKTITTVVAAQQIKAGTRITASMVKMEKIPSNYRHPHALSNQERVLNHFATMDLAADEVILSDKLTSREDSNEMPYRIPEGLRAITIAINPVSGVAGHIQPGYYVDVLMSCENQGNTYTLTLLQKVQVLAVGSVMEKQKDREQELANITLAVTLEQAEDVTLAENTGKIKLVLRPADEALSPPIKKIELKELLSRY